MVNSCICNNCKFTPNPVIFYLLGVTFFFLPSNLSNIFARYLFGCEVPPKPLDHILHSVFLVIFFMLTCVYLIHPALTVVMFSNYSSSSLLLLVLSLLLFAILLLKPFY